MLELKNVTYRPDELVVLDGLSLQVKRGEIFVIMGGSGAGKSTILRLLNGLIKPDQGQVLIKGEDITGYSEKELVSVRKTVGMVFQSAALFDSLSVGENVGFAWRNQKISRESLRDKITETLRVVGLEGIENRMPAELSGGMKKRVGLARAVAMEPEILLYDEPNAGLDPVTSNTILDLIRDLRSRLDITSVVVTHDLAGAFAVADRIALLSDGKIVFVGTVAEMQESSMGLVRKFLTGNHLPATG